MSSVDASVLLIGALFGFYGLFSALEYGVVIKMLAKDEPSRKMFTPLWEITNVWLVFGFTALGILFNNALNVLSQGLMVTIICAWAVMLARACLVIWIFYIRTEDKMPFWLVWLFGLSTFAVPLVFSSAGIYLLSGKLFWQSWFGGALMLASICGFTGVGLIIATRADKPKARLLGRIAFLAWLISLGDLVPEAAINARTTPSGKPLAFIAAMCLIGVLATTLANKFPKPFLVYVAALAVATPILLAWANRPYLIAGKLSLGQAFGAQGFANIVVIGLAILAPLICAGLVLFARLYNVVPGNFR